MKKLVLLLCVTLFTQFELLAQDKIELNASQSMSISGKGPGQDGAINPYLGQDCLAIVENIGKNEFSIRIQRRGEIIENIPIEKGETKKVTLLKGNELYFDADSKGKAKVKVSFEKMPE